VTIVMKFGGTSMADADSIRRCAGLVLAQESHRVVTVVSAMSGMTDTLIELGRAAISNDQAKTESILVDIRERHIATAAELGGGGTIVALLDQLDTLVRGIASVGELTPRSRDAVLSFGERLSSTLMAAALEGHALTGHEAGIVTDDNYGEANPLMRLSLYQVRETLGPRIARGARLVVTGFLGATQHGVMTTIGRGGSDYTATILGAALPADEIWIWSDVDGLMSADPRIVPDARRLEHISFAEAIEMGQFGAKSMHPRALEPAAEHSIPVRMRNTFNPDCAGTLIGAQAPTGETVRTCLRVRGSALVNVVGAAMVGLPGTAARIFQALADVGANIQVISQSVSESAISIVLPLSQVDAATSSLERKLIRTGVARHIDVERDADVVAVVGAGMAGVPGIAAKVFGTVGDGGINVMAIAQGSSELSICFVVHGDESAEAVRALHAAFALGARG
jgi:aspartate kinase